MRSAGKADDSARGRTACADIDRESERAVVVSDDWRRSKTTRDRRSRAKRCLFRSRYRDTARAGAGDGGTATHCQLVRDSSA